MIQDGVSASQGKNFYISVLNQESKKSENLMTIWTSV